ncbi:bZIP_1 domain-containing protein/gag_pre-integrs domain-containing protein [Cephalotus follicularis]|uniref:BZIP_1 domain-containing protein/gag_pre-integrs domain-containing protein n=1 Tax=Cephalotus follicularis TaxID=3775 RepID=A0A1Q3BUC4_CEPFO|nr:bZIP_1 domain-containing protein/gag_pre-integrs domain-containing protein [Cephalotus follicularis]
MGIQTMGSQSQSNGQQSHLQPFQLRRQNSWYNLTLTQVENQLGNQGKPLGTMNLDELLKNVWSTDPNESNGMDNENSSSTSSLQRQASLTLARALSGKTIDQVWKEIQEGQKKRCLEDMEIQEREPSLGEVTLEDFLIQAGLFAESSLCPAMELDTIDAMNNPQSLLHQMGLSPSPSVGTLSDTTTSGRKRETSDSMEKSIERRLRRKIKNRESAARSRARKQAYHNELVSKVSRLEEDNIKLKKEKDLDSGRTIGNAKECAGLYLLEGKYPSDGQAQTHSVSCVSFLANVSQLSVIKQADCNKASAIMLWHFRLGHPSFSYLEKMFPSLFINKCFKSFQCETCQLAKHTRKFLFHTAI